MVTVLEALTRPCAAFVCYAPEGRNTVIRTDIAPEVWYPWDEFNYDNITTIFREQLATQFNGSREPRVLDKDTSVHNEESVEDALRRYRIPTVNYALDGMPNAPHYARGTRCSGTGSGFKADWSCVSDAALDPDDGSYLNLVPGDTKISAKWSPDLRDAPNGYNEWQNAVAQTVSYSAERNVRYGFIVTDTVLVVLRIAHQYTGEGLAADRSLRDNAPSRSSSDTSMRSGDPSDPSQLSSQPYSDNNPLNWEFSVRHKTVSWSAHGHRLTPNLALWALAMMSLNGDNDIDYSYPEVNTWRTTFDHEPRGIRHNTSGAIRPRATRDIVVQERNPHMADIVDAYEREDGDVDDDLHEDDEDEDEDEDEDQDDEDENSPAHFSRVGSVHGGDTLAPQIGPK